jgi:hypothetical protein
MARPIDLAGHVQKLVEEKQQHLEALSRIEQTLEQIGGLLGQNGQRRGRKPGRPAAHPVFEPTASAAPAQRKRRRRRFAVSGNDLILNFVRERRKPTTREIAELWKSEDRAGKVDNTLSQLVKAGRLKRAPLGGGERGSRYSLA